jgi:glycosyltransferase involved in cell wall biosynthesis
MSEKFAMTRRRTRMVLVENSLHVTGAFASALAIAEALREQFECEFVLPATTTLKQRVESAGFYCHTLPMSEIGRSWPRLLRYVPVLLVNTIRLRYILRSRHTDVLIINDYYNLLGFMVKVTGWRGVLLTYVRLMPFKQQRLLNRVWTNLALWSSDSVLAVSQAVVAQLQASHKVRVLYDPMDFSERHPSTVYVQNEGPVQCLYLANYIAGKGHSHSLQAFSQAYGQNPALRLRFVGGDMDLEKNRVLKASLKLAAVQMGLGDVVTFDGYSNDVELDIKRADIVLNFSESESFSHTCLEACAFGRPIIATRCGGPEEIIEEGVTGLLVPVADVEAMTMAIVALAGDALLRQRMGEAGRRLVRERFSSQAFVAGFERLTNTSTSTVAPC